jgi:hypothetical protein
LQSVRLRLLLYVSLKDVLLLLFLLKFALRRYTTVLMRMLMLSLLDFCRCSSEHGHLLNELVVLNASFEFLVRESQGLDVVLLHHAHGDYFVVVLSQGLRLLMVLVDSLQKLLKKTYLGLEGETRFLEGT